MTITESNGTFTFAATDTNTTYSAGTGLQLSGNTFSTKLNSTTSLGTIGTTAKLYAVGVDANGKLCVNVPWTDTNTDTHYTNYLQIKGNGTEAVKFTQNADKSLNLKPGSNVSISAASGEITISSTDTNTSHSHSAGVGLVGSGSAGTSGTYTYKAKLRSETALTVDSAAVTTTSGRVYPVAVDKSGYLSVNVPWTNTTYTFNGAVSTIKDSNLTANRALISNGSGKVTVSDITSTELSYLDGVSSNIQTQLDTLQGHFDKNGYAKVAVTAQNDIAGNDIMTTYATKKYVGDNFVKNKYEYKSGTVVDKIFTFKSTNLVSSLLYKDDYSGNSLSGIYISLTGVQFLAPSVFQVSYESGGTAYDILTTNNMVAITTSEIDEICK